MSILNDLIKVKSSQQEDDLLKLFDEIPVYEKLSVDEKLRDLRTSEATRAKCPLLAGFADGNLYETILADLAANVYLQIEGTIPGVLLVAGKKTEKQLKQMAVLQTGIARVSYFELETYDHETMKDNLAAVFTRKGQNMVIACLIVKATHGYSMYHGEYSMNEEEAPASSVSAPVVVRGEHGMFTMHSYSVLGNNGYRFGTYQGIDIIYDVMIGPDRELYLMDGDIVAAVYPIPYEESNSLNMAKKDPDEFAKLVTSIVESVVYP